MQSLSDELLLGVLEYLADPADWARWSAACRHFRYHVRAAPLCLQLVQLPSATRQRTSRQQNENADVDNDNDDDDNDGTSSTARLYLPQLIFCEFPDSKRLVSRAHLQLADASKKYRLFTFHAASNARAYLGRNHEHPNPLQNSNGIETHVHGLAFHLEDAPGDPPSLSSPSSVFRSRQQQQYWIFHPNDESDTNDDMLLVTREMFVVGNCNTCPPIIYHTTPRLLAVHPTTITHRHDWGTITNNYYNVSGNWFVHSLPIAQYCSNRAAAVDAAEQGPPPRNTYGLQLWTPNPATTSGDNDTATPTTRTRQFLLGIPIQPKPFLSHNGGWNVYEPNAWESVLQTDVRNGMTRHAHLGRCASLYFHVWIQESNLYIHAQYLVFPLRIPILQQDQNDELGDDRHGHYYHGNDKKAYIFLCNFLWNLFAHDRPRWYAIRHYLSMAANELERLRQMTRNLVQRGGDPVATPILPPPARVDDMEDAHDDGSMGLTATHAANTWIVPFHHQREYSYQGVYVEDPDRPQLRPWNNVLSVVLESDEDASLDPNAPNIAKNMNQPAWSIVFYA